MWPLGLNPLLCFNTLTQRSIFVFFGKHEEICILNYMLLHLTLLLRESDWKPDEKDTEEFNVRFVCAEAFCFQRQNFLAFMSFHHVRFIIVKNFSINSFHSGEKVSLVMSTRKWCSLGANLKSHFHKKKFSLVHELCCFRLKCVCHSRIIHLNCRRNCPFLSLITFPLVSYAAARKQAACSRHWCREIST